MLFYLHVCSAQGCLLVVGAWDGDVIAAVLALQALDAEGWFAACPDKESDGRECQSKWPLVQDHLLSTRSLFSLAKYHSIYSFTKHIVVPHHHFF